uniref:Disease resistance N-terminal domain-containing protein n=1 Tax=Aegilops tauschii subsp. strangulata TaxID=200361 RepID=A0A453HMQ2_AEGTS
MEVLISAVVGDLVSRFISFLAQNYGTQTCVEEDRRRLELILLRMHMVVEEAEGRQITNRGMFLHLKTLIDGVHLGYYMLDRLKFQSLGEESVEDDEPYCVHLYMDKCMFGRHVEKEQLINFLLCDDSHHDCTHISILPIIGPHRIGKKTLVQHACKDERVCNHFSHMFFFKGDDLRNGVFAFNNQAASGKYLFVVDFIFDVDEAAWTNFQSYLQKLPGAGIKIVVTGRAEQVANLGTAQPIRLKSLSQEEYWYYFKALAFGSMDPDDHPKLASLGMQLAALLQGSFLGANILGELLRANPSTEFWRGVLSSIRVLVREHMSSFGTHPEDLLGRNFPVNFGSAALVGGPAQGYLVYDLREAGPAQSELPKLTSQELLTGRDIPVEDKFEVLVWRSRIPPYCDYVVTYEKQKNHVAVRKRQRKS